MKTQGYDLFIDGQLYIWLANWKHVCEHVCDLRHDAKMIAVYDNTYPTPKLIMLCGDVNASNKHAIWAMDNA